MMDFSLREVLNQSLFKTQDADQTTRLRRFSLSLYLYIICLLIGVVAMVMSVLNISWQEFSVVVLMGGASQALVFWAIRTGFSQRFPDPSLTLIQMVIGMSLLTYSISLVQDVRGGLLNGYVLIILFGSFRLNRKEFIFATSFALSGYLLVIILDLLSPPPSFNLRLELFQFAVLSVVMLTCAYIGSHLQQMRSGLKESRDGLAASHKEITKQRDELESAHRELQGALRQLGQLAVRDDLTGLFNRRQFELTLDGQIKVAKTSKTRVGVLLVDIDHFNELNEVQGREAGDLILRSFSEVARSCLRRTDYIARFGGEEFAVLLPNANEAAMKDCAERIREFVGQISFDNIEEGLRVTVSVGGALMQEEESPAGLLARVGFSLTAAKDGGRNRCVLS